MNRLLILGVLLISTLGGASENAAKNEEAIQDPVREISQEVFEVSRLPLQKECAAADRGCIPCPLVPVFRGGVVVGIKLFGVRPGSMSAKLGFQNGDLLRRINGQALSSPQRVLDIYRKVGAARRVEVELERDGLLVRRAFLLR